VSCGDAQEVFADSTLRELPLQDWLLDWEVEARPCPLGSKHGTVSPGELGSSFTILLGVLCSFSMRKDVLPNAAYLIESTGKQAEATICFSDPTSFCGKWCL
jgi:hypothetical protein